MLDQRIVLIKPHGMRSTPTGDPKQPTIHLITAETSQGLLEIELSQSAAQELAALLAENLHMRRSE